MEDDDEVMKASSPLNKPLSEQHEVFEQCVSGDSSEIMPPPTNDDELMASNVDDVVRDSKTEEKVEEFATVEEVDKEEREVVVNDDVVGESKMEEKEEEVAEVEEVKTDEVDKEERDVVLDDDVVKEEQLLPVSEELEVEDKIEKANECVKVEELSRVSDEVVDDKNDDMAEECGEASARSEEAVTMTEEVVKKEEENVVAAVEVEGLEVGEEEKKEKDADREEAVLEIKRFEGGEEAEKEEDVDGEEVAGEEMEEDNDNEDENESSPVVTKHEELSVEEEETPVAVKSGSGGKRKRGRNAKAAAVKAPPRKTVGEDVCFICLDGGELVLCDRRGCPKAYHPTCVDHDADFFKTKGRWNCGWHLCNNCGKGAHFMCFTCTFSLCKGCCKDAVVFCVRGNRGFCESCMKSVMTIENGEQNEMGQAPYDDKGSWEYLFKDYWLEQKQKLGITSDELTHAKNPWAATDKQQRIVEDYDGNIDVGTDSDSSKGHLEVAVSKRKRAKSKSKSVNSDTDSSAEKEASSVKRKARRRLRSQTKEAHSDSEHSSGNQDISNKRGRKPKRLSKSSAGASGVANEGSFAEGNNAEWASKELLDFVMHMKEGDTSVLTQFDVQALLLEYIKRNKLRDPRRQSQIICDSMLQKLFGKPRVGHFEMLKLLESHFLVREEFQADDNHGSVVDDTSQLDADDNTDSLLDAGRSKGRKSRKRGEERGFQSNLDDYAAIDMHNISLIYLRRNLIEPLMEKTETFHEKVVGSFVRIRISGSSQKQDIYRLVQIIGTSKAAEPYKVGKRTTDVMLEILNLDKTEIISIDTISNQEFTEDECNRLRQSIKCGLLSRMTVGDVLEKARELHEVRVTDWLEAEIVRLSHLRDRASENGRKKQLRECVEKLQLLKTHEERQRRLEDIPEVHADPKMDPNYESEDESEMDDKRQGSNMRPRDSGFYRRGRDNYSSRKGGSISNDAWSANARPPNKNWELNRSSSGKGFSSRREDTSVAPQINEHTWNNGIDKGTPRSNSWEKPRQPSDSLSARAEYSGVRSDMSPVTPSGSSQVVTAGVTQTDAKVNEAEKLWHYRDPTGKVQGPFSMVQLRKWSNTGYFPADLKIWKTSQVEDDSILLTDALAGNFQNLSSAVGTTNTPPSVDTSKFSGGVGGSDPVGRYDSSNLPSPTPARNTGGWGGKPSSSFRSTNQFQGGGERLPSPTPTSPSSDPTGLGRSNFSQQSKDSSVVGNKIGNVGPSVGIMQPSSATNPSQFSSSSLHTQQISQQSAAHVPNQSFALPNTGNAAKGISNVAHSGTGQNPPVYAQGWANPNLTHNNPNAMPPQLPHNQWTGAQVNNQGSSYGTSYPPVPGNMTPSLPAMPAQNAWVPPANMPWGNQPQQPVNPNMGWAVPQAPAFGPSPVGQIPGPTPGAASVMPPGNSTMGWPGSGPNPSAGNVNPGWVAQPGNPGAWGGDQNRSGGGAQWNRQSSFGSGHRGVCQFHKNGHCRKGTSCDYLHT